MNIFGLWGDWCSALLQMINDISAHYSSLTDWLMLLWFIAPPKSCHPYEPFKCPEDDHTCISIQYLCDGAPDCPKGYDEDPRLCTAGWCI